MGWNDRPYEQERGGGPAGGRGGALMWLLGGSVPLGTLFGIRIRAHVALLLIIVVTLLLGFPEGYTWGDAAVAMGALFGLVLLHELGHCFAARWVGGTADEILMWPLGGLAYTNPPHRPWPMFVTAAAGPMVNLLVCVLAAATLYYVDGVMVRLNPFDPRPPDAFSWASGSLYLWWTFTISYYLLLFNLLPIFPLDGGQILQTILWPRIGYFRSMNVACVTGMAGAVGLGIYGLMMFNLLLVAVALSGFFYSRQKRQMLIEMGGLEGFGEGAVGFAGGLGETALHESAADSTPTRRRKINRRAIARARKALRKEQAEQEHIDNILAKVSAHGMHSLNWLERRALRKATEQQRQRDLEVSRNRWR